MNTSGDVKWYIDERINKAYRDADNWRLANEAAANAPAKPKFLLHKGLQSLFSGLLNRKLSLPQHSAPLPNLQPAHEK
jgi:hypothetical protein